KFPPHRMPASGPLRIGGLLAAEALALGCDDSTAPRTRLVTVCDSSPWLAYQNEGGGWVHLEPRMGGYTFQATERLAFARGRFQEYPKAGASPRRRTDATSLPEARCYWPPLPR
ncbi:MAG TPA: hypothetical protein VFV33_18855, partial [Gemmatimonadaceae bacterium]|nr:hypothetical protein [Gemmatimonadaceae bacterium]